MLERLVKMKFREDCLADFLALFQEVGNEIRNQPGCIHLALWQDTADPTVVFTYSRWQSPHDLESYRQSKLFQTTWIKTKEMFESKAQAWSLTQIDQKR